MERGDYLPLGCYGKLPFWPEYLKETVSYPSSRALVTWIHEGRGEASLGGGGGQVASPPEETARLRLLHGEVGSPEIVAGVIRPSADQGGLRKFPFMVLTHFPRRLYGGKSYSLLPLALAPVWEALDHAWDTLASVASRDAFREILSSLRIPSPAPPRETEESYRSHQKDKAGGFMGRGDGASAEQLAANMPELVAQIRRGAGALRVVLPVSSDLEAASLDTSFWADLINRQFMLRRVELSVFLDESPRQAERKVLLAHPPLTPPDYAVIMGGADSAAGILRPAHPAAGQTAASGAPGPEVTYADLLSRRFPATR
jgi:hypothetical protein